MEQNGSVVEKLEAHSDAITAMVRTDHTMWSAAEDQSIKVWNIKDKTLMHQIASPHHKTITELVAVPLKESSNQQNPGGISTHVCLWSVSLDGTFSVFKVSILSSSIKS